MNNSSAELVDALQLDSCILLEWFNNNFFTLNPGKCKLLISDKQDDLSIDIEGKLIICEKTVKLLGIKIDNLLTFSDHISSICKKVSLKWHALARVSWFMDQDKLRLLLKAFIESQFSYCFLVWMFHSRVLNNRINNLRERALGLVYKDHTSSFAQLLLRDNSFSIHDRKLQKLAIEMYKVKNNLSPGFMHSIFPSMGLMYRGPKTWNLVPQKIKEAGHLHEFKRRIKLWKPEGCRMCKVYITNLGFIQ